MERIISTTALERMTSEGSRTPDEDLEALVGLAPVKQKTREMVARMKFENDERKERKKSRKKRTEKETVFSEGSRHMCFFGNPGTGKTTVARIITGFLFRYGYIRKNRIVEIDGNTLKAGEYTAAKTEIIIEHALGGVLFIDEAYALMSGLGSDEAIATLIKQMEDHRGDFILIIAGYSDEMRALIQTNPGFSSRIKEYLDFPDYSDNEMVDILRLMAKEKHFTVGNDAIPPFLDRIDSERALRSFGNARTVRNILDESLDRHALNFMNGAIAESRRHEICEPDVSRQLKRIAI
jgi:stage V sporulation protein K